MRDVMCVPSLGRGLDSGCELKFRHAVEHTVRSDQHESHVEGTRSDPQVVGVHGIGERVANASAREPKFGKCGEEAIADRDHRRGFDGLLESTTAQLAPPCDQRAVAQLSDGRCSEEELIPSERGHLSIELGTSAATQRSAEDAGVDDQPHGRRAAANASSSRSVSSSISRASVVASVGAAANWSADSSRGSKDVPCGAGRPSAALLIRRFYVHGCVAGSDISWRRIRCPPTRHQPCTSGCYVTAVAADIVESVEHWNENPTPFIWPKPTDEIPGTAFLGAVVAKRAREFQDPSLKRRTRGDGPTDIRCRTATRLTTAAILNFLGTTR